MKVIITLRKFYAEMGWVDRLITFHRVGQRWQSNDGNLILELTEVI